MVIPGAIARVCMWVCMSVYVCMPAGRRKMFGLMIEDGLRFIEILTCHVFYYCRATRGGKAVKEIGEFTATMILAHSPAPKTVHNLLFNSWAVCLSKDPNIDPRLHALGPLTSKEQ